MKHGRIGFVLFLTATAITGCGKKKDDNAAASGSAVASGTATATGTAPTATPPTTTPPPTGEPPPGEPPTYHPRCATLVPTDLVATTHGADGVTVDSDGDQSADCTLTKAGTAVGAYSINCIDGFDKEAAETFKIERQVQDVAKEMDPLVGRAGYRMGDTAFIFLDDDTPCRLRVSWLTAPAADAWPGHLKALMAKVTPDAIK